MRFLNEIPIGDEVELGSHTFSEDEIVRFSKKYDRQDFHMNPERAKDSVFGGIIASGWHTTAIYMKLLVAHFKSEERRRLDAGLGVAKFAASPGFDDLKFFQPIHAGDTVTYNIRCTAKRKLKSRPGWGLLTLLTEVKNQKGELALSMSGYSIMQWEE